MSDKRTFLTLKVGVKLGFAICDYNYPDTFKKEDGSLDLDKVIAFEIEQAKDDPESFLMNADWDGEFKSEVTHEDDGA